MSDTREEQRAAARFEAECASGDTISRALHRRELAEKDAQIKALADALMLARELGMSTQTAWDATTAALRLAGRLS